MGERSNTCSVDLLRSVVCSLVTAAMAQHDNPVDDISQGLERARLVPGAAVSSPCVVTDAKQARPLRERLERRNAWPGFVRTAIFKWASRRAA